MKVSKLILKIEKYIFFFIFLSNLSITKLFGRGLLIQEILILFLIILNLVYKRNYKLILWTLIIIIGPLILNFQNLNNIEFIKSYILLIIYWTFVFIVGNSRNKEKCMNAFLYGSGILSVFGIIQLIVRMIGIEPLMQFINNPFGSNVLSSILRQSYFLGLPRTNSLLYEPSIFGLLCLTSIAVCFYLKDIDSEYYKKSLYVLALIGIIISGSAISYIGLAILLSIRVFLIKTKLVTKYFVMIAGVFCSIFIIKQVIGRVNEIFIAGTSGYFRIISPMLLIRDMFKENKLFGIGIGRLESYILEKSPSYMYKVGESINMGVTVDNSIFMIILTFGLISFFIFTLFGIFVIKRINRFNCYMVIAFIFMALGTGGYNFIYFNMALALLIISLKNRSISINEERKKV